jgi:hypothetical protein
MSVLILGTLRTKDERFFHQDAGEMVRSFVGGLELIVSLLKSDDREVQYVISRIFHLCATFNYVHCMV